MRRVEGPVERRQAVGGRDARGVAVGEGLVRAVVAAALVVAGAGAGARGGARRGAAAAAARAAGRRGAGAAGAAGAAGPAGALLAQEVEVAAPAADRVGAVVQARGLSLAGDLEVPGAPQRRADDRLVPAGEDAAADETHGVGWIGGDAPTGRGAWSSGRDGRLEEDCAAQPYPVAPRAGICSERSQRGSSLHNGDRTASNNEQSSDIVVPSKIMVETKGKQGPGIMAHKEDEEQ